MTIPYVNLGAQWESERDELLPIIDNILSTGQYIAGEAVEKFEKDVAKLCDVRYVVTLNSGTDALTLALHSVGVRSGDEVITPPNSFIASTGAIVHLGARPVFVDVRPDLNIDPERIEQAITAKTKAIMPVHLTGRIADMNRILAISEKYDIPVIEDAAQAIGSKYENKPSGSFGKIGCFSVHPLKNLNACGDGGFITTNDEDIFLTARSLRNHGLVHRDTVAQFGYVSRMDTLQASILNYRLRKLEDVIAKRKANAEFYFKHLNRKHASLPEEKEHEFNTYHTFVVQVQDRDELRTHCTTAGIETAIHYPTPIHLQPAAGNFGYKKGDFPMAEQQSDRILTLPIHQHLTADDLEKTVSAINAFYE